MVGRNTKSAETLPRSWVVEALGRVGQQFVNRLASFDFEFMAVRRFLTFDAELRPRHSVEALDLDVFLAVEANPIAAISNTRQRAADVAQHVRFAIEVPDGQLAFAGELYFIESVRGLFNGDVFPVTEPGRQFGLTGFQHRFVFVEFGLVHGASPSSS